MESSFSHNQLVPGDPGYEYDSRVEFEGGVTAGWDSGEDFWE